MARYCRNCGSPVKQEAKFCRNCGTELPSAVEEIPTKQAAAGAKFCRFCGNPVREGARFCKSCGQSLAADMSEQEKNPQTKNSQPGESTEQKPEKAASPKPGAGKEAPCMKQAVMPGGNTTAAAKAAGEIDLGEFVIPGLSDVSGTVTQVLSPVSGISHGVGSYLGGIINIFKKPSSLIGTIMLAALWFVLARLRGSDSEIVKTLSWLTYARGGFDRSGIGMLGGVLGKGAVAASLVSLLTGGLKYVFKGIGRLLPGNGRKRNIVSIAIGIVIGAAVYLCFVGPGNASGSTAMAGVAGILLSLEALGSRSGKLFELARSLTSRSANGVNVEVKGKCEGLLAGLAIGFALATLVSAFL